jgi:hypothetical protein
MNQEQEAQICLHDAVELDRPPSDIRFFLVSMVHSGASGEILECRFRLQLADERNVIDSVHRKIDALLHPESSACWNLQEENEVLLTFAVDESLSVLTSELHRVPSQIIEALIHQTG